MYKWDEMNIKKRDSLVAEKVFGYVKQLHGEEFTWVKYDESGEVVEYQPRWFSPSRRISDAWEVVEKMQSRMIWLQKFPEQEDWDAIISTPTSRHSSFAKSAPEAICKAALKAVGIEIE